MRGRYLHNVDIPLPKAVEGAGLLRRRLIAASAVSGAVGGARSSLWGLASGCCENDPEFGQIDDNRWSARAIWAVRDDRWRRYRYRLFVSPGHKVALVFCGMVSAGSRPSGRCNHRLSSICPSLTLFFQQAGLKSVCRGGFGVALYRIWARRRVSLEAPRHDQGRYGAFGHHDLPRG